MKNKNTICMILILFMVILVIIACFYVSSNKERIFGEVQNETASKKNDLKDESAFKKPTDVVDNPSVPVDPSDSQSEGEYGFKMITTYAEFDSLISRKDKNMYIVFGREGCYYCEQFVPVLKDIVKKYKVEVLYVDMAYLSQDDYANVINTPLTIPAKCSKTGEEIELKSGFGTPLSLFVNNQSTYSCIRGYKDKANLITLLKRNKYIK